MHKINEIKKFILDLVFPIYCLGCNQSDHWICDKCFQKIKIHKNKRILDYQKGSFILTLFSATDYKNPIIKKMIHCFKYKYVIELKNPLKKVLIKYLQQFPGSELFQIAPIIIPIPLHKKRQRQRGFNQAELLAEGIAKEFGFEIQNNILIRIKHTTPQIKLTGIDRKNNLHNSFQITDSNFVKNKNIILFDDIYTTGATMQECAKLLTKAGAKKIYGLVLAQ